jgi:hypothetical protein
MIGFDLLLLWPPEMMDIEFQQQGFGCGEGLPVAAMDHASG